MASYCRAENPAKTTECMAPILAQAKMKQLIPGSLVNKYKLDLLWLCLVPAKHLPFCKPVDAIRYRKYARLLQKGLKYYGCFITSFVKMPIDAVFSYVQFCFGKPLISAAISIQQLYPIIGTK
jgi:hypothetical protein